MTGDEYFDSRNVAVMFALVASRAVPSRLVVARSRLHATISCSKGDSTVRADVQMALHAQTFNILHADPPYCLLERRRTLGDLRDPKGRKNEATGRFANVAAYRQFTDAWMSACAPLGPRATTWIVWTNFLGRATIVEAAARHGFVHLAGEFLWCKRATEAKRVPVDAAAATAAVSAPPPMRRFDATHAAASASLISHIAGGGSGEVRLSVVEFALVLRRVPLPSLGVDAEARCWSVVAGHDDDGESVQWDSHPNHKPFSVLEPLLRGHTRVHDTILEPFAGSGSTLAAAHRLGRSAIGIEKDARWAAVAQRRIDSLRASSSRGQARSFHVFARANVSNCTAVESFLSGRVFHASASTSAKVGVMGQIQLILGPMFSGKTSELLRRVQRHALASHRCTLLKSARDTRYTTSATGGIAAARPQVTTHDRHSMTAVSVMRLSEAAHLADATDVFGIDEGQFFPDLVEFAEQQANAGKIVIVSALDGTFQRRPFGSILELVPRAESVTKLCAVCRSCGCDAAFSHRLTPEKKTIVVAGSDKYEALCRACWTRAQDSPPTL